METARMSAAPMGHVVVNEVVRTSAAVESAVDAYATRVLKTSSPPEACIDESLGPYVTSLLRCSLLDSSEANVTSIPEFDSLVELLEEHCSLSPESATGVLQTIATAVKTGVVQDPVGKKGGNGFTRAFETGSLSVESAYGMNPDALFGVAKSDDDDPLAPEEFPALSQADGESSELTKRGTPLKPDRLIPIDLLGVLDDPSTPVAKNNTITEEVSAVKEDTTLPVSKKGSVSKKKKNSKKEAGDLAALLFRPSRIRQNSIDADAVSRSTNSGASMQGPSLEYPSETSHFFQQQWDAAVEMLLSMNPDLSEDAAAEAAYSAGADINVAQYIVDSALSAPPVCRHLLNEGCYRSDCHFSHDVDGHTCLFWMRGRCGKGESCRFLHGFSERMMEGIHREWPNEGPNAGTQGATMSRDAMSTPVTIATTNLLSHNMQAAFSAPQHESSPFSSFLASSTPSTFDGAAYSVPSNVDAQSFLSSSWGEPSALETAMKSFHLRENQERSNSDEGFSFASIASKGYSGAPFTTGDYYKTISGSGRKHCADSTENEDCKDSSRPLECAHQSQRSSVSYSGSDGTVRPGFRVSVEE